MPWGVHSEYSNDEDPEVDIDEEQEEVDRTEEGSETTEDFDIDDAIGNLGPD
jgi:phosphopantothenoylcysteine synthetase/decarboxylase